MKRIITSTILVLLLMLCATPVYAGIPELPHAFYGDVEINNSPAPDGTEVSAKTSEGEIVASQNPVTTVGGSYGVDSLYLLVQGNSLGGTVTFYVNGIEAVDVTAAFEVGGGPDKVDLSVTITKPKPPPSEGGAAVTVTKVYTDLFGEDSHFYTSSTGRVKRTVEATSKDGMLVITIPKGTTALNRYGNRLKSLQVAVDESPPDPPEDAHIIGLTYDFNPDGATFDPAITFTWSYDPDALSEGEAEEDLTLAYHDGYAWVELECTVNTDDNTIVALVSHFTEFAIIGKAVPEVVEPEIVEPEPAPPVVTPPVEPPPVIEPAVPEPTPPVPAPPTPEPTPIGLIIGCMVGIVVAVIVVVLVVRRLMRD